LLKPVDVAAKSGIPGRVHLYQKFTHFLCGGHPEYKLQALFLRRLPRAESRESAWSAGERDRGAPFDARPSQTLLGMPAEIRKISTDILC
jgi:hypothetical protein